MRMCRCLRMFESQDLMDIFQYFVELFLFNFHCSDRDCKCFNVALTSMLGVFFSPI